ncbi:AMP-binding protein [Persicobacter psychrovividus]|uniref:O-succinylbenzoic acid--CoA ligase n=1 Tax=Persicobacter psychrovividus TaxID=387638 RepID=A0ABM7VEG9_9BACT|nr:O-succinylbenzoic acid--CoA ligase [Persicobacter psychrovividus]
MQLIIEGQKIDKKSIATTVLEEKIGRFIAAWQSGQQQFSLQTSGSTGKPKIIEVHRQQMQKSAALTAQALGLKAGETALLGMNPEMIGGRMMIVRALELNLNLEVVRAQLNPVLQATTDFDFVALVPAQLQEALQNPVSKAKINQCKNVIIGGAPMSYGLKQACQSLQCQVFATYGMTETVSHIALQKINGIDASKTFNALPDVKLQTDHRGCLVIDSPTAKGQIITNDLVRLTSPSTFIWQGRADFTINTGGVKVQVETIEQAIEKLFFDHQILDRFIITSQQDDRWGEKICLIIETSKINNELLQLITHQLQPYLPDQYYRPKCVAVIPSFDELASGKLNRSAIKNQLNNAPDSFIDLHYPVC